MITHIYACIYNISFSQLFFLLGRLNILHPCPFRWEVSFNGNSLLREVSFQENSLLREVSFKENSLLWEVSFKENAPRIPCFCHQNCFQIGSCSSILNKGQLYIQPKQSSHIITFLYCRCSKLRQTFPLKVLGSCAPIHSVQVSPHWTVHTQNDPPERSVVGIFSQQI